MDSSMEGEDKGLLYLHHVTVETPIKSGYRVKLTIDHSDIPLTQDGQTSMWKLQRSFEVNESSNVHVTLKTGHTIATISFGKEESMVDIDVREAVQRFLLTMESEILVSKKATFRQHDAIITVSFRSPPTSESVRSMIYNLQEVMGEFRHIMGDSMQQNLETIIKYGVAFSELDPRSKAAFSVLTVTFELLKQQKGRDQMVSDLARQLKRILPFAKEALKEAVEDNADILRKAIGRLYALTMDIAEFCCDYVKRNRFKRLVNSVISTQDQAKINELTSGLRELVENFDRAVNVEMLKTVRSMEEKMLLDRLEPIKTVYKLDRGCMQGTRTGLLDDIVNWAIRPHSGGNVSAIAIPNIYWLYGIPGVGKTAMAHSICARLHQEGRLGGMFFCRRDDPDLSDPKSVLPTLVFNLAERWGAYRKLLADRLRKDPNLTRHSAENQLFSRLLESLQSHPPHSLVLVIDALDECGDNFTRNSIISTLLDACSRVSWLRIIVTSRQDSDIESSFKRFEGRYAAKDLASDDNALRDIRLFTKSRLSSIATQCGLPNDWPGDEKLDAVVERSGGLFIFVETLSQLLGGGLDPDECLTEALSVGSGSALERLYNLYTIAIHSRIDRNKEVFRLAIGTIIAVGQYQPLSDEAVADLAGLRTNIVTTLVNKLGSLLYRDTKLNGGIRVRHLSVIDFLTGPSTSEDLRVDITRAHRHVAISSLKVMTRGLRFNICGIESSFMSNRDVVDLQSRVDRNISATLQYSCVHWSDHLSHIPDTQDEELIQGMAGFTKAPRLLYWMEALSVMGKVPIGDLVLRRVPAWLKCSESSVEQNLGDALKFIFAFREAMMTSAPHTYISGLAFVPTETELWRYAKGSFRNLLSVAEGRKKSWPDQPHMLTGHSGGGGGIRSVSYSPDGRRIISGSSDNTTRIWDAETGAAVGEPLAGHTRWVCSVVYSPDGRRIISGSDDNTIRMWDAETGTAVGEPLKGHTAEVNSVAYSPDGRHIVSGSNDKTIRIWDAETGSVVGEPLEGHTSAINSVAYSADGRRIISSSRDKTIRIWDAETGASVGEPLAGHNNVPISASYSPDGRRIVYGSWDKTIRIRDSETRAAVGEPLEGHTSMITIVTYSADGRHIISGSYDRTIRIWDAETGAAIGKPLEGHTGIITSVAYSPDGRRIISGSDDDTIRIWDAETGAAVGVSLEGHTDRITSIAYSADSRRIISGSWDNTIRVWDAETGAAVGVPLGEYTGWVHSVVYSPDGRIISGSYEKTIRMWDADTGAAVGEPLEGHTSAINSVAYSADGLWIISGSDDNTIRMWDAETGTAVGEPLKGHTAEVNSVAYSPDGRRIISGSDDRTIRIWDAETGSAVGKPLEGHTDCVHSVAYSPDGQRIISGSEDERIRIWDAKTGVAVGKPLEGHAGGINSVAYSADGRYIISGSSDKTICIWDAETGAAVGEPLEGHTSWVHSVSYSSDGRRIISGSDDKTIRIWDTATVDHPLKGHINPISSNIDSAPGRFLSAFSHQTTRLCHSVGAIDSAIITNGLHLDSAGWVHHPDGGLLFWVPGDCRNGLTCPAILTIPTSGHHRRVCLSLEGFIYGLSWTNIKIADP